MSAQKAADKKYKQGKQAITTGVFKWSKDYASGASLFNEALKMYKAIPNWEKCLKTLDQLILCNQGLDKMADPWAVARNIEQIIDIKIKQYPETTAQELKQWGNKCFINFRMAESTDKGLTIVGKVAKYLIERGNRKEGTEYLEQAYKTISSEQKVFKKQDIFNHLIDIYLENKVYEGAQKMYLQQIQRRQGKDCEQVLVYDLSQMGLIVLILIIIQREPKRAQKKMFELAQTIQGFLTTSECEAGEELIKAYTMGQEQKFRKQTTRAIVTSIYPLSIVRTLREITVPKMAVAGQNKSAQQKEKDIVKELLF